MLRTPALRNRPEQDFCLVLEPVFGTIKLLEGQIEPPSRTRPGDSMDPGPSDKDVARLVEVIRTANVRDAAYQDAERELIALGPAAERIIKDLLTETDVVVRERASELLKKLPRLSS